MLPADKLSLSENDNAPNLMETFSTTVDSAGKDYRCLTFAGSTR